MKSVLAATSFITTMPAAGLTGLTRGQLILQTSRGTAVAAASDIEKTDMLRFVLGLGDGETKQGVWINPNHFKYYYKAYQAPGAKTFTFSNITADTGLWTLAQVGVISMTVTPKNYLSAYPEQIIEVIVTRTNPAETEAEFLARMDAELTRVITKWNTEFGYTKITQTGTLVGQDLVLGTQPGEYMNVHVEGLLHATVTPSTNELKGDGTQAEVSAMEVKYMIPSTGYHQNYAKWQHDLAYNENSRTAGLAASYNMYTIVSRSPHQHVFDIQSEGMFVTQFLAIDSTVAAEITALDEIFTQMQEWNGGAETHAPAPVTPAPVTPTP